MNQNHCLEKNTRDKLINIYLKDVINQKIK